MPTYLYETIPQDPNDVVQRFEVKQRFTERPLVAHPETGVPVRRVISGGLGPVLKSSPGEPLPVAGPGCGPDSCTCGRFGDEA
ncbi:MAG TPA: hypothetical protein VF178_03385 [Gemmatimonadaceae bacterium]